MRCSIYSLDGVGHPRPRRLLRWTGEIAILPEAWWILLENVEHI
jgi:hypothetical protein